MKKSAFLLLLFTYTFLQAQTARKYSNEFMNIGVDAAALGMSNTVVASTQDVNSGYWNPAGLVNLTSDQGALMHASYFANLAQYDYAAYAKPIDDRSAWGLSMIRFGVDNIMNTTELIDNSGNINYDKISYFSTADYGFTFSYAKRTPIAGLQYGVNAKVIHRIIGDFANSWGFGFDFGLQYRRKSWQFGLMARDITTTYNIWSINEKEYQKIVAASSGQTQEMPQSSEITLPKLELGMARKFNFHNNTSLLTCANLNTRFEQTNDIISGKGISINPAVGFEFAYSTLVFLRAGFGNFQNIKQIDNTQRVGFQPNMGLGFRYKGIQIDYALTDLGNQSAALYSNIFSLKMDFDIFRK